MPYVHEHVHVFVLSWWKIVHQLEEGPGRRRGAVSDFSTHPDDRTWRRMTWTTYTEILKKKTNNDTSTAIECHQ